MHRKVAGIRPATFFVTNQRPEARPLQLTTTVTLYHLDEIYHSMEHAGVDLPDGYGGDAIQKSHYLQTYINSCYPEADACERATFARRLPDLIDNLKSATAEAPTQTDDTPLAITADIRTTQVLKMRLAIPDYQRPYVWDTTNVGQMLTDIKESRSRSTRTADESSLATTATLYV